MVMTLTRIVILIDFNRAVHCSLVFTPTSPSSGSGSGSSRVSIGLAQQEGLTSQGRISKKISNLEPDTTPYDLPSALDASDW